MAIYYIRMTGDDANAGTSPANAWRTFSKALGSSGISSGDTVYIGAGVYREIVTVSMTSATTETSIVGDITGEKTGDTGEVQLTAYLINDQTIPTGLSSLLDLNGADFLTFKNISFIGSNNITSCISASASVNIKLISCLFRDCSSGRMINLVVNFGISANWIIDKCIFFKNKIVSGFETIQITLATGIGADYNANIFISNCIFFSSYGLYIISSGTDVNEGGGIQILNCIGYCPAIFFQIDSARIGGQNFNYPSRIINCLIHAGTAISASEVGQIIENHNIIYANTIRVNTSIGPQTISDFSVAPFSDLDGKLTKLSTNFIHGDSLMGILFDKSNNKKSIGINSINATGTATSATITTITDTNKNFPYNGFAGHTMKIIDGKGKNQVKTINSNNSITVSGDGKWMFTPDNTSKYIIYGGMTNQTSLVSTGSTLQVVDNYAQFGTNSFQGYTLEITSGTAAGQNFIVSSNSSTGLIGYYPMSQIPASGDAYSLYLGAILKGTVSTGSTIQLVDNLASWPVNFWTNWRCMITSGVASGANFAISGNSTTGLSGWNTFAITPASGDKYVIYQNTGVLTEYYISGYVPGYGTDFLQCSVGCYEKPNTAIMESGSIFRTAPKSLKLFGPATQDFDICVNPVSTTISVYGYYDNWYSGILPQLAIIKGQEIGVQDITGTMVGASGQWEQISVNIVPSGKGIVTARVISNSTGYGGVGSAYFDDFAVT